MERGVIYFHGTIPEAQKRFSPNQKVVCRWETDKDRTKHYLSLILKTYIPYTLLFCLIVSLLLTCLYK